jgi:hypothetical protein
MNSDSGSSLLPPPTILVSGLLLALGFLLFAIVAPRACERILRRLERVLARLASRKTLVIALLFLAVISFRLAILPLLPVPTPSIHDEFSYLLMADTFAHGRLANPPHPMWVSFETFHVNWFPTYFSKYPPGQGAALALGQVLGSPWIGVLLSNAAMCAAMLWMLQAWLPARWALHGGALVALKFGFASYWMNSYWGGAVAAAGGALVLGALPRLFRRARVRDALLLGSGIAILANTRPYEGFLFCIPIGCWFLWWLAGRTKSCVPQRDRFWRALLPLAAVLVFAHVFMGYYNWRLTGNAFLFPHTLNSRTYRTMGLFLWDHPKPPQSAVRGFLQWVGTRGLSEYLGGRLESHLRKTNARRRHVFLVGRAAPPSGSPLRFSRPQNALARADLSFRRCRFFCFDLVHAALCLGNHLRDFHAPRAGDPAFAHHAPRAPAHRSRTFLGRGASACA